MQSDIAKTAFLTSIISYGVFLLFEYLRPGFVQYVFSVHWFLLAVILSGIWYGIVSEERGRGSVLWRGIQIIAAFLLAIILLREGEIFGDLRILMALAGFVLPFVVARFTHSN